MVKKYIKSKSGQSYMFALYKGNCNLKMHVSLEEDVEFKGFVYKDKMMSEVHCIITNRHFDFEIVDMPTVTKIYLIFRFLQDCQLNVCLKSELTKLQTKVERNPDNQPNPSAYLFFLQ